MSSLEYIANQTKLAEAVLREYAENPDRFTRQAGRDLGLAETQINALEQALGPARTGMWEVVVYGGENARKGLIDPTDRNALAKAGFSKTFIETLAGQDGKEALRRRASWLGKNAVALTYIPTSYPHNGYSVPLVYHREELKERSGLIDELGALGAIGFFSQEIFTNLALATHDEEPLIRHAAERALKDTGRGLAADETFQASRRLFSVVESVMTSAKSFFGIHPSIEITPCPLAPIGPHSGFEMAPGYFQGLGGHEGGLPSFGRSWGFGEGPRYLTPSTFYMGSPGMSKTDLSRVYIQLSADVDIGTLPIQGEPSGAGKSGWGQDSLGVEIRWGDGVRRPQNAKAEPK